MEKGKRSNDHTFCCVYDCHSSARKRPELSFHLFPKKGSSFVYMKMKAGLRERVDRKIAWEKKLLMGKKVTPYMKVCSLHFKPEDFYPSGKQLTLHQCEAPALQVHMRQSTSTLPFGILRQPFISCGALFKALVCKQSA